MAKENRFVDLPAYFDTIRKVGGFVRGITEFIVIRTGKENKPVACLKLRLGTKFTNYCCIAVTEIRIPCARKDDITLRVTVGFKSEYIGKFKSVIDIKRWILLPWNP